MIQDIETQSQIPPPPIDPAKQDGEARATAFQQMLEANQGILYKVANSYCKDPDDRKDLVQEIALQLWRAFERYDPRYKASTWMYRIALNVAISHYRKAKKHAEFSQPLHPESLQVAVAPDPNEAEGKLLLLQQFIASLPELDRALILLYLDGQPQGDIAEVLGLSLTNVSTKTARIKKKLRKMFQQHQQA